MSLNWLVAKVDVIFDWVVKHCLFILYLHVNFSGLFVIDDKGILRNITVNDMPVGRSVEEVLRLVQAFQFNDKHGEGMLYSLSSSLCPFFSVLQLQV